MVGGNGFEREARQGRHFEERVHLPGTFRAEHLPPSYPERAAWGTVGSLRAWQEEAIQAYLAADRTDFLVSATPGAGKTTYALRVAALLRAQRVVKRIVVVAPTEHLKYQWADAAERAGIRLNPGYQNAHGLAIGRHYHGIALTYAQVAMKPLQHQLLVENEETLVILDEIHHAADALSWGDAVRTAFMGAKKRLALTGTPFRSDEAKIPFVRYEKQENGTEVSQTDYDYGYARALAEGVVRPVVFMVYAGKMKWETRAGECMVASLEDGNTKDVTAQAWRTALDPAGEWISAVLDAANRRLSIVRQHVSDAGGLVIASDHAAAKAYASILERITREKVTLVLSDDPAASSRIESFSASDSRWMVAVRMVSEGVDVPRLSVGVYATSASTPLFFAQAIGRFVRSRRRGETATVFIPHIPVLLNLAAHLEQQRDHVIDIQASAESLLGQEEGGEEQRVEDPLRLAEQVERQRLGGFARAIESSAHFDSVVYDGSEFGGYAQVKSEEELEFLGIPGLLDAHEVRALLTQRQQRQAKKSAGKRGISQFAPDKAQPADAVFRTIGEQRRLLHSLVGLWAKTSGESHASIHAKLRAECGGPEVALASVSQLQERIKRIRSYLARRP